MIIDIDSNNIDPIESSGISRKYRLFGSSVEFYVDADESFSEPILNDAYKYALKLQKIFNLYDKESEISILNRDRSLKASSELIHVLKAALKLCESSGGEYDVSLGKRFLERKGQSHASNDVSSENLSRKSLSDEPSLLAESSCSYKDIEIHGQNVILKHPDVWLDLGSIAKGYIAERIAEFLMDQGIETGFVDARGDLAIFGEKREIGIQHPRSDSIISTIRIKDMGVATSGDYKQYINDYSHSHILHQKDIISATVVAKSLMEADAYATILMVCDKTSRENMIKESGYSAMIIDKHLNIIYYNGFEKLII